MKVLIFGSMLSDGDEPRILDGVTKKKDDGKRVTFSTPSEMVILPSSTNYIELHDDESITLNGDEGSMVIMGLYLMAMEEK